MGKVLLDIVKTIVLVFLRTNMGKDLETEKGNVFDSFIKYN